MVEIGDSLELRVVRNSGRGEARWNGRIVADMRIYHEGSVVVWTDEPAFEMKKTCIDLKDGEAAWDTIARAIAAAKKAGY